MRAMVDMKPQIQNRTLFTGDNLPVLRGMNCASADLIYLDPPFNSNKHYSAPVGSQAAGASFKDAWTLNDEDEAWHAAIKSHQPKLYAIITAAGAVGGRGDKSYLIYMAIRILEMRRILKDTGSIYLHVDPTMSHSLKLMMDAVFGKRQFQNEFIWYYGGGGAGKKRWGKKHDVLLFYSNSGAWTFNMDAVRVPHKWAGGQLRADGSQRSLGKGKIADDVFTHHAIMPWAKERMGYPTQKPLALLERIIKASSNEGDVVLDPFCGCATTCVAAEILHRNWIGVDISPKALDLVRARMQREVIGEGKVFKGKIISRTDIPHRTDVPRIKLTRSQIRKQLYGNQAGICNGCEIHFPLQNFTVDHIVPTAHGGADIIENLQLLCGMCNSIKGDRTMEYLKARLREMGHIK